MNLKTKIFTLILLAGLALVACTPAATPAADGDTADIPVVVDAFAVVAEGRLVPR